MTALIHRYDLALESAAIAGFSEGELAERARIKAILENPAAIGREGCALHLALATDTPASIAASILETMPRGASPARNVRALRVPELKLILNMDGHTDDRSRCTTD